MATINAADRTGPNLDVLADAVVDASPVFPFHYTPVEGFTALNPAITYTPGVAATDAVLSNIPNTEVVLAICTARYIMVTNKRILRFGSGWGTTNTHRASLSPVFTYAEGLRYTLRLSAADKDNLTVTITAPDGQASTATLTFTDLFAGNPVFHLGYLTDAQIANIDGIDSAYDVTLHSMTVVS